MNLSPLTFRIELNVLKHLGIGLYSSTPAVVTEIIANAWDADASLVSIDLDIDGGQIVVQDDGHGMTRDDVQSKFLAVGYSRRTTEKNKSYSQSGCRRVMGRKGIGKLAMFSLAKVITVVTKSTEGEAVAFSVNVDELLKAAEAGNGNADYAVQQIPAPDDFTLKHGTRITLTSLSNKLHKTEEFLRPRLARRFGVFSDSFRVQIGGRDITRSDAGYYGDIQFLWCFDEKTRGQIEPLAGAISVVMDRDSRKSEKCCEVLSQDCVIISAEGIPGAPPGSLVLSGFIASVDKPKKLGVGDDSLNKISVFANGRLFQEDILPDIGDSKLFNSYLVGEVHADFLDDDDRDRATASREAIRRDDERFQALRAQLRKVFSVISARWDDWRIGLGYDNSPDRKAEISEWIGGFKDARDRKAADKLMTSIGKLTFSNDDVANDAAKNMLYGSAIVGFEKLRAKSQLDKLEGVDDVFSPEFQAIFASVDEIEAAYYFDIAKTRLEIIEKFEKEIVDEGKQEKVAQKYLFDHLWLLDPTWDRVSGSEDMEVRLSDELKRACPETEKGARLDIAYRTTAGRHVVIELKRPGLRVGASKLEEQGRRYLEAVEQWYREHPDFCHRSGRIPAIDIYFLVDVAPDLTPREMRAWEAYHLEVMTYKGMIGNARLAYQSYLSIHKDVGGRVVALLDSLRASSI